MGNIGRHDNDFASADGDLFLIDDNLGLPIQDLHFDEESACRRGAPGTRAKGL